MTQTSQQNPQARNDSIGKFVLEVNSSGVTVVDTLNLNQLAHPTAAHENSPNQREASNPFQSCNSSLVGLITDQSSGELFNYNQVSAMLSRCHGIDSNVKAVDLSSFASAVQRHTGCSQSDIAKFCSKFLDHYDIRALVIRIDRPSDMTLLQALPAQPERVYICVNSLEMLNAKTGMQSNLIAGILDTNRDLSELTTFSLIVNKDNGRSLGHFNAAPLLTTLAHSATKLHQLRLDRCDISGNPDLPVFSRLDYVAIKGGKGTVNDIRPFTRARTLDLKDFDICEDKGWFVGGWLKRGALGDELGAILTEKNSRVTNLVLPPMTYEAIRGVLGKVSESPAVFDQLDLTCVNVSGVKDSGFQGELERHRDKIFLNQKRRR